MSKTRANTPKLNIPKNAARPTARMLFHTTHHQPLVVIKPNWLNASPKPPPSRSRFTQSAGRANRFERPSPIKNPASRTTDVIARDDHSFGIVTVISPRYQSVTDIASSTKAPAKTCHPHPKPTQPSLL